MGMTAPVQTDDDQGWTPRQLRRRQAGPMWGVLVVSILSIIVYFLAVLGLHCCSGFL